MVYNFLKTGPLSISIDISLLQFYKSGIFNGPCTSDGHGVILVGYGIEYGKQFWLVRNSWGPDWGEKGYIRVARNESNRNSCFVTNEAFGILV